MIECLAGWIVRNQFFNTLISRVSGALFAQLCDETISIKSKVKLKTKHALNLVETLYLH